MAEPVAVKTSYRQGDRCLVSGTKPGTIQFVGPLPALGSGLWVGVFHDDAVGNTNGRVNGRRIFDCPLKHGGFYHANDVDVQSAIAAPVFSTPAPAAEGPTSAGPKGRWAQVRDQASALVELGSVSASASTSVAAGRGLSTAIVNQVSQVLITCHDANGLRREAGGDLVSVAVRGVSPPSKLRVKIHDHSNGQYIAEYKAELTGQLLVHISINGYALAHSPFAVTAVTLRADPVRCALRGEALTSAIARRSMTFEIDFVDGLGQVAVAEDVDVRLERFEPLPAEEVTAKRAKVGLDSADLNGKSDPYVILKCGGHEAQQSTVKPKTLNPVWNEEFVFKGTLTEFVSTGLEMRVFDCDNPLKPEKDDALGEVRYSLRNLKHGQVALDGQEALCTPQDRAMSDFGLPGSAKGKMAFTVTWDADDKADAASKIIPGDERVVIGSKLILRRGFEKYSEVLHTLPPGTRLQLHELRETSDGFRTRVRVLRMPNQGVGRTSRVPRDDDEEEEEERRRRRDAAEGAVGWITAAHKDGRKRLANKHLRVDNNDKRYQLALWQRRLAADKSGEGGKVGLCFSHETDDCPKGIAFACGGVFPGTLHSHGALTKTHTVSYSVGAAGKYLMFVGLRQQTSLLPGSPFVLEVRPGPAHAVSTHVPEAALPLNTIVGTEGRMVVLMLDNMSNPCDAGGAALEVSVNSKAVTCRCVDQQDGTFLISWSGQTAGRFTMDVKLGSAHIRGSPTPLTMAAGDMEISRCEMYAGRHCPAGVPERLKVQCHDAFDNDVDFEGLTPPFGLTLLSIEKGGHDQHRRSTASPTQEKQQYSVAKLSKEERAQIVMTRASLPFEGVWEKSIYWLTYVPTEAGEYELSVWCDLEGAGTRNFLPGCPLPVTVSAGRASASGSFVRDAASVGPLTAGDDLNIKVQMCDEYGNNAPLASPEIELRATLETPEEVVPLVLKSTGSAAAAYEEANREVRNTKKGERHASRDHVVVGLYEFVSPYELVRTGVHKATIRLRGDPITVVPLEVAVKPAAPLASKSWLQLRDASVQPLLGAPIDVVLQLVDKFGNHAERGGHGGVHAGSSVRVDAKVFGSKASDAKVVDNEDGTFAISFTAFVAGDYKLSCRLENAEMQPLMLHVIEPSVHVSHRPARRPSSDSLVDETEAQSGARAEAGDGRPVPDKSSEAEVEAENDSLPPARMMPPVAVEAIATGQQQSEGAQREKKAAKPKSKTSRAPSPGKTKGKASGKGKTSRVPALSIG